MSTTTPTPAVSAIGNINISGNVIPASWWRHIQLPSGRPDQTAITLLSEVVYWYRPSEVRDENTGALVGYRKRFHGDKLQRSYQAFADQFGFSKREATDALKRLRDAGFITLELRTVKTSEGITLSNVLFIEPVPESINDINSMVRKTDSRNVTPVPFERNTPSTSTEPLLHSDGTPPALKSETYTEITTETKTKKISCPVAPQPDDPGDNFLSSHPDAAVFSAKKRQWGSQEDLTCAEWLWNRIIRLYEQAAEHDGEVSRPKSPNWVAWANEIRLMCTQDGRTHRQICELFGRANRDPFWCRNILSPLKLREKWDDLSLKLSASPGQQNRPGDLDWDNTDWVEDESFRRQMATAAGRRS